jgi:hypothetical protein
MCTEGKKVSVFLGTDPTTKSTTARDANELAGTGVRAEKCPDWHNVRGVGMARGGEWDRFAGGREHVGLRDALPVEQPVAVDGKWQLETHWDLDTAQAGRGRFNTVYRKTICEPTLE